MPLVLGGGVLPTLMASVRGPTPIDHDPAVDEVDRVLVVRYPSRRRFLALVSDPAYGPLFPYKFAAVEIALVPTAAAVAWALACALRRGRGV